MNISVNKPIMLGVILTVVAIGLTSLLQSHAASSFISTEPENGTVRTPATITTDATASDAKAVKFVSAVTPTPTPAPPNNFITRSGTNLMLNGKKFQFVGFDGYGMTGCRTGAAWTKAQLDTYFSNLPVPNGVTRLWAFQGYGTARIQAIVTEAAKYNQRLILTLGDDDSACNDRDGAPGGDGSGKTLAFYQTGWKGKYLTWVNTIVPLFKNSTTVAMWEIANEPGQAGTQPDAATMKAYLDGAAAAIKAQDPNHLVSTGAGYNGNFGGQTDYINAHSGTNVDVVSFHDYSWDYENKAVVSSHFNEAKAAAAQLNKPFIAGEAGVESGATCTADLTLSARSSFLKQKADDYINGGIAGIDFWDYEPGPLPGSGQCWYDINPGDPLVTMVKNYAFPD